MSDKKMIQVPSEHPSKYNKMPKGLTGYWWETDNLICVPLVESQNEGDGKFTEWIKNLEDKHKMIFFPTIVSGRLDFILRKRGYQDAFVMDRDVGAVTGLAKI